MDASAHGANVSALPPRHEPPPRSVDSLELLQGARELVIRHGDSTYRLRVTASQKLILTK